ncbi:MAG: beta-lactamase family protein [Bacteroidales bacterium]|nr:beta-lactamase family protein [Bacteroidales bacterium]
MKHLFGFVGIFLTLFLSLTQCVRTGQKYPVESDPLIQKIADYLDQEGENGFSGTVLVKIPGQPLFTASYGFSNQEKGIKNSAETVFDIGSLTKQFTAAAILKLEMDGKLSVHDKISRYIIDIQSDKSNITIHHLLTHTSGLPYQIGTDHEVISRSELINRISESTLANQPGESHQFSNAGYNLLGVIIEEASGMSYEKYLEKNLLKPAGLRLTGYRIPDWSQANMANGYRHCRNWGKPIESGWIEEGPSWNQMASVGILSTALDLYAWHEALTKDDLLPPEVKDRLYYPYFTDPADPNHSTAYGWMVIKSARNTKVIAHYGWDGKFYTDFLRYVDDKVTIILLSNRFRMGNPSMSYEIANCIFRENFRPQVQGKKTDCHDSLPKNRLGQLAGKFLGYLESGTSEDWAKFIDQDCAKHLVNKYSQEHILEIVTNLQNKSGAVTIRQVRVTDNRVMDIELISSKKNCDYLIRLFFDEEDDYRIRGISFDFPENN